MYAMDGQLSSLNVSCSPFLHTFLLHVRNLVKKNLCICMYKYMVFSLN